MRQQVSWWIAVNLCWKTSCSQATSRRCHYSRLSIASLIWIHAGALRICSRRRLSNGRDTRWSNRSIKLTLDRNDQYICWQLHAKYPVSQKVPDIVVATVVAAAAAVAAAESTPRSTSLRLKFGRTSRSRIPLYNLFECNCTKFSSEFQSIRMQFVRVTHKRKWVRANEQEAYIEIHSLKLDSNRFECMDR